MVTTYPMVIYYDIPTEDNYGYMFFYPLVIFYIAMENRWPIEIDGLPNLKMVDLSMANC